MTNMWRRLTPRNATVAAGIDVLRTSARTFQRHRARRLSAGLAYYSLFAFIPTVFIATAIGAAFVGEEATEGRLADRLDGAVGAASAEQIEDAVAALWQNTEASAFAVVSVGLLVYSASALFVAWRDALNVIWDVPYQSGLKRRSGAGPSALWYRSVWESFSPRCCSSKWSWHLPRSSSPLP